MTVSALKRAPQRRHKTFEETHQNMIETAVQLISEKGVESLSVAVLAREMGLNRTTVYYHFSSRDELVAAVKAWSSEQLMRVFSLKGPQQERINYITRFVLDNPQLIKLWIEDFVTGGDIRHSYPNWDQLVTGVKAQLTASGQAEEVDAEVFCVNLLVSAIIGPRVLKNSVRPDQDRKDVVQRFQREHERVLGQLGLLLS